MSFWKRTVKEFDLRDKTVLVRADYNVPLDEAGKVAGDYRLRQSVPTLKYLLEQNCKIVICSHLGRPNGAPNQADSLGVVAKKLQKLLGQEVAFVKDCVGETVKKTVDSLGNGQIVLLENLRFYPQEVKNDDKFAAELASLADVFVQDGFGVVHREHASVKAITNHLPSVAGLLLEREATAIVDVMEKPQRPLAAVVGGAKIADKIDILNRFIDVADFVAVGGAMANTFLRARGLDVGKSKVELGEIDLAKEIIEKATAKTRRQTFVFYLPQDAVVAKGSTKTARTRVVDWDAHIFAAVENYPKRPPRDSGEMAPGEMILDIGPFSGAFIAGGIQLAQTVIWNGTMGVTEVPSVQGPVGPFAHGTEVIVDALLGAYGNRPFSVIGGGDTVSYLESRNLTTSFNHVSTGGGAALEMMGGRQLPGIEALLDK